MTEAANAASRAAREGALFIAEPTWATLILSGPDAKTWLNGIVTCDVKQVTPSVGAYGLLLSRQGKIQADLYLVEAASDVLIGVGPSLASSLLESLNRFLVMEDAELRESSEAWTWGTLHGPKAAAIAAQASLRFGAASGAIDRTGLGGAALALPTARRAEFWAWAEREPGVVLGAAEDWRRLRIESGVGALGVDFSDADNPHEAALDRRAVSWTKGCYLGQEVVCMQDMRGKLKRRLVPLSVDTEALPATGSEVRVPGRGAVGEVTSSAWSALLGKPVVLARLRSPHFEVTAPLEIAGAAASRIVPDSAPGL
jgi:tRNA-modifying protein YgfZ